MLTTAFHILVSPRPCVTIHETRDCLPASLQQPHALCLSDRPPSPGTGGKGVRGGTAPHPPEASLQSIKDFLHLLRPGVQAQRTFAQCSISLGGLGWQPGPHRVPVDGFSVGRDRESGQLAGFHFHHTFMMHYLQKAGVWGASVSSSGKWETWV